MQVSYKGISAPFLEIGNGYEATEWKVIGCSFVAVAKGVVAAYGIYRKI